MILDSFQEQVPFDVEFKDLILLESLAWTVKNHFGKQNHIDDNVSQLVKTYITDKDSKDESSDNFWHAIFKEVDLYIDHETFEDLICEPLVEKILHTAKKLRQKIKSKKLDFEPSYIIFTGSLSNLQIFKEPIKRLFKCKESEE